MKFISMLETKALYFTRIDHLGDKFEGSMSQANLSAREHARFPDPPPGVLPMSEQLIAMRRSMLQQTFVNCWTLGGYESVAMWREYIGTGNGVAIESTFGRLTRSIVAERRSVFGGKVQYIDYAKDIIPEDNAIAPFIRKRKSFEHEKEVRFLIGWHFVPPADRGKITKLGTVLDPLPPPPDGLAVPVDLEQLVTRVRISPDAPEWFAKLVDAVLSRYGLRVDVSQSDIDGEPVY